MTAGKPAVALAVLALAAGVPATAQERVVTLDEAIRLAERVQPGVVQAQASLRNAEADVRSAWGAYLPSLNLGASGSESYSGAPARVDPITNQVVSGRSNGSVATVLSASVDLFTGFRRGAQSRAARATSAAAAAGLVDARYQQRLATTQQFFDALAAAQLVRVRETSVRRAEEQLRQSIAKLQVGSATRSDTLRSRVSLGTAQVNLANAQGDLAAAEAGLARLIGAPGRVRAADDSSFYAAAPIDTTAIRAEALERSPQVQSARAAADAARASVGAARAQYWPTLSLSGSTGFDGTRANDYSLYNTSQVRLQLSWSLFDRFNREAQIVRSESEAGLADAQAADRRLQVDAAVTAQLARLEAARTNIAITQTSVAAAEEDLRVLQERYRVGLATILDVLTSQEALSQAEVDAVNARFDYLRAKAQLEAIVGHPL